MTDTELVDQWVSTHLEAAGCELEGRRLPGFGTRAWLVEPSTRVRWASVLAAGDWARRWWANPVLPDAGTPAGEQLRQQVRDEIAAGLHDDALGLVRRVARSRSMLSYAERRARELEEAVRPRPGDFPGVAGGWLPRRPRREPGAA